MGNCISSNNSKNLIKSKIVKSLTLKTSRENDDRFKDFEEWNGY